MSDPAPQGEDPRVELETLKLKNKMLEEDFVEAARLLGEQAEQNGTLRRENKRLREALESMLKLSGCHHLQHHGDCLAAWPDGRCGGLCVTCQARAALDVK